MIIRVQEIKKTLKVNFKMKKTYINPSIVVVRLGMTQPIAGSGTGSLSTTSATFYDDNATGAAMTKGIGDVNVWDDEW